MSMEVLICFTTIYSTIPIRIRVCCWTFSRRVFLKHEYNLMGKIPTKFLSLFERFFQKCIYITISCWTPCVSLSFEAPSTIAKIVTIILPHAFSKYLSRETFSPVTPWRCPLPYYPSRGFTTITSLIGICFSIRTARGSFYLVSGLQSWLVKYCEISIVLLYTNSKYFYS